MAEDSTEVQKAVADTFIADTAKIWKEYKTKIPGDSLLQAMENFKRAKGVEITPTNVVLAAERHNQILALRLYDPVMEIIEERFETGSDEIAKEMYQGLIDLLADRKRKLRASLS